MSRLSSLKAALGPPVWGLMGGSRVTSGSPARYILRADQPLTISAIWALVKRHLELDIAKRKIEEIMVGGIVTVDLPMLEDAAAFQNEMRELGISAVQEKSAAAAQGISG
jgi:hypothetical protein